VVVGFGSKGGRAACTGDCNPGAGGGGITFATLEDLIIP
jgi:hypothetical protein